VRSTARTSRSLPCKPGAVPKTSMAATRPLSLICRSLRHHSTHALLRVTTLTHLIMTFTPGHAVACSRMPTVISLTYSDLTHAVPLTHGRSLTRTLSLAHVVPLTLGVSLTQGVSLTHTILLTHAVYFTRGASFPHGVLGSTHFGTLATTPLTHAASFTRGASSSHGVSVTHTFSLTLGVSFIHGASSTHAVALTHALAPTLCARRSTHFTTIVYTHFDTTHTGTIVLGIRPRGLYTPQAPRSPHLSPLTRSARPDPPGHDPL